MVGSSIIQQKMSCARPQQHQDVNNSSLSQPEPYPAMADTSDYEVQLHVNFETRELRLLKVLGDADGADIYLFTREKCQPDCADANCRGCRTRKLYQDKAGDPQGLVPYSPNQEYLYCLRFDQHPVTALLALTPRENDVEVQEKGVLAYWFMKWLERSKILEPQGAVAGLQQLQSALLLGGPGQGGQAAVPEAAPPVTDQQQMAAQPAEADAEDEAKRRSLDQPAKPKGQDEDEDEVSPPECSVMHRPSGPLGSGADDVHRHTSDYLPNMQVIYQVKKDQMSVVLPKPEQLTRPIEVILLSGDHDGNNKRQTIVLEPGDVQSTNNLVALRNTPYTLQVQLHDKGHPVDLLDFITEHKILRVQESKHAPKQLNFLMERLIEQRGTFVLHITFDEKIVEVGTKPIGEFYLDVDVDSHKMMIGTIESHASKFYRVEKISKQAGSNVLLAEKQLIFEGGVDPTTLSIRESIPIERMSDYVITVVDPDTKQSLPTSVLAFHKHALFVKEIKNSDVRLHVTVQRQPSMMLQSSNANNLLSPPDSTAFAIRRPDNNSAFHCPFRSGWTAFRIHHSTTAGWFEPRAATTSPRSVTPATASSTADTASRGAAPCLNLDVDLPRLKARLVSGGSRALDASLFVVYEESFDGKLRSTPCKMGQAFKIRHWSKYTVKRVEASSLTPVLTFCATDKEVTDIRACSAAVRVGKRFVHEVA